MLGVAGYLTALLILHRYTTTPRALATADVLAADLLSRARGRAGWTRDAVLGFAHGRAGILFSLLGWSLARDRDLPNWFFRELSRLADDAESARHTPRPGLSRRVLHRELRSWCGGATGEMLLWTRAFERTGDATYLRLARRTARFIQSQSIAPADLCCGLTGRSYALLAMDRIEPGRGWRDRAIEVAVRAGERMQVEPNPWPNGLYKGYPGLVCLALDLQREPAGRMGFPLVDG